MMLSKKKHDLKDGTGMERPAPLIPPQTLTKKADDRKTEKGKMATRTLSMGSSYFGRSQEDAQKKIDNMEAVKKEVKEAFDKVLTFEGLEEKILFDKNDIDFLCTELNEIIKQCLTLNMTDAEYLSRCIELKRNLNFVKMLKNFGNTIELVEKIKKVATIYLNILKNINSKLNDDSVVSVGDIYGLLVPKNASAKMLTEEDTETEVSEDIKLIRKINDIIKALDGTDKYLKQFEIIHPMGKMEKRFRQLKASQKTFLGVKLTNSNGYEEIIKKIEEILKLTGQDALSKIGPSDSESVNGKLRALAASCDVYVKNHSSTRITEEGRYRLKLIGKIKKEAVQIIEQSELATKPQNQKVYCARENEELFVKSRVLLLGGQYKKYSRDDTERIFNKVTSWWRLFGVSKEYKEIREYVSFLKCDLFNRKKNEKLSVEDVKMIFAYLKQIYKWCGIYLRKNKGKDYLDGIMDEYKEGDLDFHVDDDKWKKDFSRADSKEINMVKKVMDISKIMGTRLQNRFLLKNIETQYDQFFAGATVGKLIDVLFGEARSDEAQVGAAVDVEQYSGEVLHTINSVEMIKRLGLKLDDITYFNTDIKTDMKIKKCIKYFQNLINKLLDCKEKDLKSVKEEFESMKEFDKQYNIYCYYNKQYVFDWVIGSAGARLLSLYIGELRGFVKENGKKIIDDSFDENEFYNWVLIRNK